MIVVIIIMNNSMIIIMEAWKAEQKGKDMAGFGW